MKVKIDALHRPHRFLSAPQLVFCRSLGARETSEAVFCLSFPQEFSLERAGGVSELEGRIILEFSNATFRSETLALEHFALRHSTLRHTAAPG